MIDQKYLELIQAEIDGELAEHDRAELARHLLANREARVFRDDLKRLCDALDRIEPVEPPPGLRSSILGSARLPACTARPAIRRGWLGPPRALGIAAALAGGLLVSVLAFQVGLDRGADLDVAQVTGTMASPGAVSKPEPVDTVELALEQVSGSVTLLRSQGTRIVEFDLRAYQPVEVVVTYDGQETRSISIGRSGAGESTRRALTLDAPRQDEAAVGLKVFASGVLVYEDVLQTTTPR